MSKGTRLTRRHLSLSLPNLSSLYLSYDKSTTLSNFSSLDRLIHFSLSSGPMDTRPIRSLKADLLGHVHVVRKLRHLPQTVTTDSLISQIKDLLSPNSDSRPTAASEMQSELMITSGEATAELIGDCIAQALDRHSRLSRPADVKNNDLLMTTTLSIDSSPLKPINLKLSKFTSNSDG
ncbi:unnamed protein product [Protopolystoma xenopodis]|uniref:Uncharacterized protein n=1 Tax=Protopolystoma xenopodis TaxID=117903 RepID=A0A448WKG5_9PLAT|nr:unnamed protein product [Protopolystoma xenopodis]